MPIVVDEVVISVDVTNAESGGAASGGTLSAEDRQALVAECVEQVMELLRQREEP